MVRALAALGFAGEELVVIAAGNVDGVGHADLFESLGATRQDDGGAPRQLYDTFARVEQIDEQRVELGLLALFLPIHDDVEPRLVEGQPEAPLLLGRGPEDLDGLVASKRGGAPQ